MLLVDRFEEIKDEVERSIKHTGTYAPQCRAYKGETQTFGMVLPTTGNFGDRFYETVLYCRSRGSDTILISWLEDNMLVLAHAAAMTVGMAISSYEELAGVFIWAPATNNDEQLAAHDIDMAQTCASAQTIFEMPNPEWFKDGLERVMQKRGYMIFEKEL